MEPPSEAPLEATLRRLRWSREPRHGKDSKEWRCPCRGLSTQRYLQRLGTVNCSSHASSQGPAADEGNFFIFNVLCANDTCTNTSWPHWHRHKPSHLPLESSTSMSNLDSPAASRREGTQSGGESSSALSVSINFRHYQFYGHYPILGKVPNFHLLQNAKTWRSHNAGTYTDTLKCIFQKHNRCFSFYLRDKKPRF